MIDIAITVAISAATTGGGVFLYHLWNRRWPIVKYEQARATRKGVKAPPQEQRHVHNYIYRKPEDGGLYTCACGARNVGEGKPTKRAR